MFNLMRRAGVRLLAIGLACASAQYMYAAACGQTAVNTQTGLLDCVGTNGGGAVLSVFGRTGAIVATSGDYNFSLLGGALSTGQDYSTAVTPGTYGDATHVRAFTVNAQGRITAASSVAISGGGGGGTILAGNSGVNGIAASSTNYAGFSGVNQTWQNSGSEFKTWFPVPFSGTVSNLYLGTGAAQSSTGSVVCTVRVAGVSTSIAATVPASGQGPVSDTTDTASITAGQMIALQCVNNATVASTILSWSIEIH